MEPNENKPQQPQEEGKKYRNTNNLYAKSKVSVKFLDGVIVAGIAALVIVFFLMMQDRGFEVLFDSVGGTDVPSQTLMYGDFVQEPEAPTRQGYNFDGWYWDDDYELTWDFPVDTVAGDMCLYARWEKQAE